jgi:SAM-dependent methyltransferase
MQPICASLIAWVFEICLPDFAKRREYGEEMREEHRGTARAIAHKYLDSGEPLGWFEELYSRAGDDVSVIPWADLEPNPNLVNWLNQFGPVGTVRALKVGSGLGDDAEELARRGFLTTAFDISEAAIAWSRRRFPRSSVSYVVADLFSAPTEWEALFDFVLESYTLQVLPPHLRAEAVRCIASFVAPGGTLLIITRGREPSEPEGKMPWPLTREEISFFETQGLKEVAFDDYMDAEDPPVRRFRATYRREDAPYLPPARSG